MDETLLYGIRNFGERGIEMVRGVGALTRSIIPILLAVTLLVPYGPFIPAQAGVSGQTIFVTHAAIHVDNESELSSLIATETWSGTGSIDDPYVIRDLEIDAKGQGVCIFIGNTTSFLIIQECHLFGGKSPRSGIPGGIGISLYQVQNVVIKNNDCSDNYLGINLLMSSNGMVMNNTCDGNTYNGVKLENCTRIKVVDNECLMNSALSIEIFGSEECVIENNTCNDSDFGILVYSGRNNTLRDNTCKDNVMFGIVLYRSENNVIEHNFCEANGHFGINLEYSSKNRVIDNVLVNNNGAKLVYDPTHRQAQDLGGNNSWNNSTSGNYWSDWNVPDADGNGIVDSPYVINSDNGNRDQYPLASAQNDIKLLLAVAAVMIIILSAAIGILFVRKRLRSH